MNTVADLNDRERERTEHENNMRQNISNHNVFSPRVQDEEHQLANMSHMSDNFAQRVQHHRRAGEAAPPRPTGQYHNPDHMVTDRLAGLGECKKEMQKDPLIKQNMSAHIARLSQDVVDCGFSVAKGAHAAVLIAVEEGRANWAEPHIIESIRRDSVSRVYLEAAASARQSFTPGAFWRCSAPIHRVFGRQKQQRPTA